MKKDLALYLIEILHQTTTFGDALKSAGRLYLIEILHQTTTKGWDLIFIATLYLIEILHQTTTCNPRLLKLSSCILSKFYIKPQQRVRHTLGHSVVSYRNSTSNHNLRLLILRRPAVVSYRNSTSNHNSGLILIDKVLLTGCLPL